MNEDIRIVVLQRGWVAVGKYTRDGDHAKLEQASIVRRWGTDKGLGQLAAGGPRPNTVLDTAPPIEFHTLTEVMNVRCNPEAWAKHFEQRAA